MRKILLLGICYLLADTLFSQTKLPISVSGTMGVSYEGYGLDVRPPGSNFYAPRRPWNQVRFNIAPTIQFGKNFSLPFNFNFATNPVNFAGPYAGIANQTFGQWLTNPMNNFSINPKYKWAEAKLGTQYLKYSDLSTGDVGAFGAGFNLHPGKFIIQFFTGTSQQGVNYVPSPPIPGTVGAFRRTHWMAQIGKEEEGKYHVTLNFAKGIDKIASISSFPPTLKPQESFVMSFVADKFWEEGWYVKTEWAQSFFTADKFQPLDPLAAITYKPFMEPRIGTTRDFAVQTAVGKKGKNFDIGASFKQLGGGFRTTGFPFMQSDFRDITLNTRINTWKNKININANIGKRTNNISSTSLQSDQIIANINWFTQFNDKFTLNVAYNNFGFETAATSAFGVKNVSNDFTITPTYTWTNTTMSNILTLNYSYNKYKERLLVAPFSVTDNNTHSALLSYIPIYFNKQITPDFSVLYFNNSISGLFKNTLLTFSSALGLPVHKNKIQMRGQIQYTVGKIDNYTANNNFIASLSVDWKINKKLIWKNFMSTNYFKYGNELVIPSLVGANYLESNLRTSLQYTF